MNQFKDKLFSVNLGVLLSSILVAFALKYITRNALATMDIIDVVAIVSLNIIFLFFADLFKKNNLFIFIALTILMGLSGVYLHEYREYLKFILIGFAAVVFILKLKLLKNFIFQYFAMSFLASLFFIILIFSSVIQILSPVFLELIVNGKAITDTLFHTAISNSIVFNKIVSTEIHGVVPYKYHWFSHFLYGGLSSWTDLKAIKFYNWVYPVFIIPIFIKYFFVLYEKTLAFYKLGTKNSQVFFIAIVIYVTIIFGLGGFPSYLSSQSLILAHIFQFIFWALVIEHEENIIKNKKLTLLMFLFIVLLLFTKASIGLLTFVIAGYLYLRYSENKIQILILGVLSCAFILICYYFFYSIRPEKIRLNLVQQLTQFTESVISYFTYSISIFFIINYLIDKNNTWESIKNQFKFKKIILEEMVLLSIFFSFFFGFFFNGGKGDALYFASTFSLLNLILICIMLLRWIKNPVNSRRLNLIIYGIFTLSFVMSPQFLMIKYNTYNEKNNAQNANPLMKKLVMSLMQEKYNKETIVTVAPGEDWFYIPKEPRRFVLFLIPAISELPALMPISKDNLRSNGYSFSTYEKTYKNVNTEQELIEQAKNLGYKELIIFESADNQLQRKSIKL